MQEFWETNFIEKQTMWGFEPANSAILTKDLFLETKASHILIPGIGYGRNAGIFLENGIKVTGIEISQTAINLAKSKVGLDLNIYHGSVCDMPFDNVQYDGIFCYALIHLLNQHERKKFIRDCYNQLKPGSYMVFITISKQDPKFGKGHRLSKDRYTSIKGANFFFYDADSIKREFGTYGLIDFREIEEPIKFMPNHPSMKFTMIICQKSNRD